MCKRGVFTLERLTDASKDKLMVQTALELDGLTGEGLPAPTPYIGYLCQYLG